MKTPITQIISEPPKRIGFSGALAWSHRCLPAALTVATGILLFGPPSLVAKLGLAGLMSARRDVVGAVCLIAFAVLMVAQALPMATKALVRTIRRRIEFRKGTRRLRELTRSEKNLLNQFLARKQMTLMLDPNSGATQALQRDGIIDRAAEMDESETSLAFTLRSWVREYLRDNVHLVENPRTTGSGRVTDIHSRQTNNG